MVEAPRRGITGIYTEDCVLGVGGLSSSSLHLNNNKILGLVFSLSHVIASRLSIPSRLQYFSIQDDVPSTTILRVCPDESDVYYAQQQEQRMPKIVCGDTTE